MVCSLKFPSIVGRIRGQPGPRRPAFRQPLNCICPLRRILRGVNNLFFCFLSLTIVRNVSVKAVIRFLSSPRLAHNWEIVLSLAHFLDEDCEGSQVRRCEARKGFFSPSQLVVRHASVSAYLSFCVKSPRRPSHPS